MAPKLCINIYCKRHSAVKFWIPLGFSECGFAKVCLPVLPQAARRRLYRILKALLWETPSLVVVFFPIETRWLTMQTLQKTISINLWVTHHVLERVAVRRLEHIGTWCLFTSWVIVYASIILKECSCTAGPWGLPGLLMMMMMMMMIIIIILIIMLMIMVNPKSQTLEPKV